MNRLSTPAMSHPDTPLYSIFTSGLSVATSTTFTRLLLYCILAILPTNIALCDQLLPGFYQHSCPQVDSIVSSVLRMAAQSDARITASLLRMHFHDCFVQGCDGSVLLDDNKTFTGEKNAGPNANSLRGFEVIDQIKAALEKVCPQTVSCADLLAIVARESVVLTGGPSWNVLLGRRDSTMANKIEANNNLPSPTSNVSSLIQKFKAVGLSEEDMVTLSGAHTIGKARCTVFSGRFSRLTSNLKIRSAFVSKIQALCPPGGNGNVTVSLDQKSRLTFDHSYFKNLVRGEGLLISDQVLFSTQGITKELVWYYSTRKKSFFHNFKAAMIKMGNLNPLTGSRGQIRTNCRRVA